MSLLGVAAGAIITYTVNVRSRRREFVERLFSDAIADVAAAQAAMQFINSVPPEVKLTAERAADLEMTLREEGYKRFVQLVAQARVSLAQVVPYRDDLRPYLSSISGVFESADPIIAELRQGPQEQDRGRRFARLGDAHARGPSRR